MHDAEDAVQGRAKRQHFVAHGAVCRDGRQALRVIPDTGIASDPGALVRAGGDGADVRKRLLLPQSAFRWLPLVSAYEILRTEL